MIFDEIKNKKANFNYFIEETFEAGLVLEGWEVKSILNKKANLDNSYVIVKDGALVLLNALFQPLETTATYTEVNPTRSRNLLMHKKEISKLIGLVEQKGYTLMPLKIVRRKKLKLIFGLGKGKNNYDKRQVQKDNDWKREKEMLFKKSSKSV